MNLKKIIKEFIYERISSAIFSKKKDLNDRLFFDHLDPAR